jgi:hypothetical protein
MPAGAVSFANKGCKGGPWELVNNRKNSGIMGKIRPWEREISLRGRPVGAWLLVLRHPSYRLGFPSPFVSVDDNSELELEM